MCLDERQQCYLHLFLIAFASQSNLLKSRKISFHQIKIFVQIRENKFKKYREERDLTEINASSRFVFILKGL